MKEKLFDHIQIVQSQFEAKIEFSKNRSEIGGWGPLIWSPTKSPLPF